MPTQAASRSPLEQSALQAAAGPHWQVVLHDEAESTNALAAADPVLGAVVVAEHQTAGRGRLDRVWQTPRGTSLTFSAVLNPRLEPRWWPLLPMMTGVALARAIGPQVGLKWPNDAQIEGRKICGILVERVESSVPLAVIGIGLNVNQVREELPVETATSLALEGLQTDRTALLARILEELRGGLGQLQADPHTLMAAYRERSLTIGQQVRVLLPDGSDLVGTAADIADSGELMVRTERGETVGVHAGDVVHVRRL